jgi:hypothetical protein
MNLPGWVVDNVASVHEEIGGLRDTTPAQRWQLAVACTKDTIWALSLSDHADQALAYQDPLPGSTLAALRRLRREVGWGSDDP